MAPNDPYSYYYKALVELRQGDSAAAVDALVRAVDLGYPRALLRAEPYLEPIRRDREFMALLADEP